MKEKTGIIKAIVLAGGFSQRIKLKIPKQLVKIDKRAILSHTLDVFEGCKVIDSIMLVVPRKYLARCRRLVKRHRYRKIEQLCLGGKTRQESVFNALQKVSNCDYVIIHDGVRPLVSRKIILRVIKAVKKFAAVTCAVKATDTIVKENRGFIDTVLDRKKLMNIQTPQAFKFSLILKAHQKAVRQGIFNASDDSQLLLRLKKRVRLVEGSYKNIKVTTMSDLQLVKNVIASQRSQ